MLFAERGLEVILNDIAHHARVGVATVCRRFPDKDELVRPPSRGDVDRELWRRYLGIIRRGISARPDDEPPLPGRPLALAEVDQLVPSYTSRRR